MNEIKLPADAADRKIFARCAPAYWAAGLSVIPIQRGEKRPALPAKNPDRGYPSWTDYCRRLPDVEDRETWLKVYDNCGIGLALGPASGVVVMDVDTVDPDQIAAIEEVLPASPWRRVGSKGWAAAYRYAGLKPFKIKNDAGETLVEHLAEGNQVVLPPTVHPKTGQAYMANCELLDVLEELVELPADIETRLREALGLRGSQRSKGRRVVTVADREPTFDGGGDTVEFFGIRLPARCGAGGRDDTCTRVTGSLAAGVISGKWNLWSAESALEAWFSKAVEQPIGDELPWDKWPVMLWKFVGASAEEAGGRAGFGWREGLTDHELIVRGLDRVRDGDPIGWIARSYIYAAREDAFVDRERGSACPSAELMRKFKHMLPDGAAMLRDDAARDFVRMKAGADLITADYMALRPEMAPGLARDEAGRTIWNSWLGYAVTPRRGGCDDDVAPFLGWFQRLFPDLGHQKGLLDWTAWVLQNPGKKVGWCPLVVSDTQGIGKSLLGRVIGGMFHPDHAGSVTTEVALGQYTDWAYGKVFIQFDEVYAPEKRVLAEKLKLWITEPEYVHRPMYGGPRTEKSKANFWLTSNHERGLLLDKGSRRFFMVVIRPDDGWRVKETVDFGALTAWIEEHRGTLLGWFLDRDVSGFDPYGDAPITDDFRRVVGSGMSRADQWLDHMIECGEGCFGRDIVSAGRAADALRMRGVDMTPQGVAEAFKGRGYRALPQMRVRGRREVPWIIRNPDKWLAAGMEAVRDEMDRTVGLSS